MYGWFNTKCPKCDYLNPDKAKFCKNCDSDLREQRRKLKEERRRIKPEYPSMKKRSEAARKRDRDKEKVYERRLKARKRVRKRAKYEEKREQFIPDREYPYGYPYPPPPPPQGPAYHYPPPYPHYYPYPPPQVPSPPKDRPQSQPYPQAPHDQYAYPYPVPYPYQYPYPQQYPFSFRYPPHLFPSLYGDIYAKPAEEPRLRLDILPKILFKPKSAFTEIYPHTFKKQGIMMFFILTIFYFFIQLSFYIITESISNAYYPFGPGVSYGYVYPLIALLYSIPIAILSLYLTGYFSAKITKEMRGGRADVDKTIGLLGYANVVNIVFSSIVLIIITLLNYNLLTDFDLPLLLSYAIILIIVAIIAIIWSFVVNGYAVAVANNITLGRGIAAHFLGSIVAGLLTFLLMIPLIFFSFFTTV